jgi:TolB-like protein/class 3 adenylate cyclase/Flp pilus assembly protein TadD
VLYEKTAQLTAMANCSAYHPTSLPDEPSTRLTIVPRDEAATSPTSTVQSGRAEKIEIGHVLFIDIVGYSQLLIHAQTELQHELKQIVRGTEQFRAAEAEGKLLRLPTGDGMVLVFRDSLEAPARCALEISAALQNNPRIQLRMGIHSGPVNEVRDVNENTNLAGAGINIAQRVMDCGDAGHILLSKHVAEDLEHFVRWEPHLHEIGDCEVKHGTRISVVNLCTDQLGNRAIPSRLSRARPIRGRAASGAAKTRISFVGPALVLGCALLASCWYFLHRNTAGDSTATNKSSAVVVPVSSIPEKSIAVLPFENLSTNQEAAFFADGVQDEILTNLAKVADLKVISRTSVMQYRTVRARNLREIGRQLGVARVLEGSVQRINNRIRVNAQLIDARTDAHLWAQVYDRDLADVFAIQSEIARTIADQLQANLSPREKAALNQVPTTDLVAEKLFRQAWQQVELASNPDAKQALLTAVSLLDEALGRDPQYLRASGLLVTSHIDLYWQGFDHTPARLALARQAIEHAAKFHPDAGEVHLMRADYAYKAFRDYAQARAEVELARRTLPNNSLICIYAAAMDRRQGRWAESIKNWERGIELDPRNFRYLVETGFTYQAMRRFTEAGRCFERALSIKPQEHFTRTQLAQLPFLARAEVQAWRAQLRAILDNDPNSTTEIANGLFDCAMAEHDRDLVTRALQSIRPEGLRDTYNNSLWARDWFIGLAARTFGDTAQAKAAFTSARAIELENVAKQPDYAPAWSRLGLIDAGLSRKEEAIQEGRRACALLPITKDAVDGPSYVTNLAMIYAWVGDKDRAIEELSRSAQVPGGVTYGELKLYPQWDSLRGDPRFEKIVASLKNSKS